MRRLSAALLPLALSVVIQLPAQDPAAQPQEAPKPPELPRIVGQAQSQEELDSWKAVEEATDLAQKEALAKSFLANYPKSGLTPYIHYSLATAYRKANQTEAFVEAAEKALMELPQLPEISSDLAFLYAETGRGERAVERAHQTLDALQTMHRPRNATSADWAKACHHARANADYALGRAELDHSMSLKGEAARESLVRSASYLEESLREDPGNPYPAFRLGQAYTNLGKLEEAIQSYARATAVGGVIAPFARQKLEEVYKFVHKNLEGVEEAVQRQKRRIEEEVTLQTKEMEELRKASESSPQGSLEASKPPSI